MLKLSEALPSSVDRKSVRAYSRYKKFQKFVTKQLYTKIAAGEFYTVPVELSFKYFFITSDFRFLFYFYPPSGLDTEDMDFKQYASAAVDITIHFVPSFDVTKKKRYSLSDFLPLSNLFDDPDFYSKSTSIDLENKEDPISFYGITPNSLPMFSFHGSFHNKILSYIPSINPSDFDFVLIPYENPDSLPHSYLQTRALAYLLEIWRHSPRDVTAFQSFFPNLTNPYRKI